MRRTILLIIIALAVSWIPLNPSYALTDAPQITGVSGVLIDADTGTVLFDKYKDERLEPASTTKVMTALLALENLDLDKKVTIDEEASFTEGSRIYLLEGEVVTVEELLHALLIESANDAAVALAKEISGSVEDFSVLMNERAKELGARNTTFVNPHGLHAEGHLSTAYDLALIAQEAMKNETFRELVLTYKYEVEATNKQPTRYLYNTNRLIYDQLTKVESNGVIRAAKYDGTTGIKTGFTPEAGGCLVSGAERDGTEFIAVVLGSSDSGRFGDSIALLDFGFENYKSVTALEADTEMGTIKVKNGEFNKLGLILSRPAGITLPKEASESIVTTRIVLPESVQAPVEKGQQIGTVEVYEGDSLRGEVPILATKDISKGTFLSHFGIEDVVAIKIFMALKILGGVAAGLILILTIYVLYKKHQIKKKRLRRKQKLLKMAKERHVRY